MRAGYLAATLQNRFSIMRFYYRAIVNVTCFWPVRIIFNLKIRGEIDTKNDTKMQEQGVKSIGRAGLINGQIGIY